VATLLLLLLLLLLLTPLISPLAVAERSRK
jgi:hypothetical protein